MPCFGTVAPSVLAADLTLGASASVLRSSLDILLIASIHSVLNQDVDILAWGEDMCGSPFPLIFSAESSVNESGPLKYSKNKLRGGEGNSPLLYKQHCCNSHQHEQATLSQKHSFSVCHWLVC